jgi:hypothetical protein
VLSAVNEEEIVSLCDSVSDVVFDSSRVEVFMREIVLEFVRV